MRWPHSLTSRRGATKSLGILQQFRAVSKETRKGCAVADEYGGATESGIQMMAMTRSKSEECCTLKSVSGTGEAAFIGDRVPRRERGVR